MAEQESDHVKVLNFKCLPIFGTSIYSLFYLKSIFQFKRINFRKNVLSIVFLKHILMNFQADFLLSTW